MHVVFAGFLKLDVNVSLEQSRRRSLRRGHVWESEVLLDVRFENEGSGKKSCLLHRQ